MRIQVITLFPDEFRSLVGLGVTHQQLGQRGDVPQVVLAGTLDDDVRSGHAFGWWGGVRRISGESVIVALAPRERQGRKSER